MKTSSSASIELASLKEEKSIFDSVLVQYVQNGFGRCMCTGSIPHVG